MPATKKLRPNKITHPDTTSLPLLVESDGLDKGEWVTPKQLCERVGFVSEGALRWWLFHRENNGLDRCVRRFGTRRLLIHVPSFHKWLVG